MSTFGLLVLFAGGMLIYWSLGGQKSNPLPLTPVPFGPSDRLVPAPYGPQLPGAVPPGSFF